MAKTKKVAKFPKMPKVTVAQLLLAEHLKELGLFCVFEHRFLKDRRFRFDVFVPEYGLGLECNGGRYKFGHRSSRDTEKEYEKSNLAAAIGYKMLNFTNEQVESGYAKSFIKEWVIGK